MKIAYMSGDHFLEDGLLALEKIGFQIFPLVFEEGESFEQSLAKSCPDADLAIIELFGNYFIPTDISTAKIPTIAYGIDSTINTYLYKHLFKLFDYVFVDQENALEVLNKSNIDAKFLPLCISEKHFREYNDNPKCEISFIGRLSRSRKKRANLIAYLEKNHGLSLFSKLSLDKMQDIIANSRITLNENLFNGLNFRVLQCLAAGTILFNEENMQGMEKYFIEDEHYISYNPSNLLIKIKKVESNPDNYKEIALKGQEICRKYHTASYRVQELFAHILACDIENVYSQLTEKAHQKQGFSKKQKTLSDMEIAYAEAMYFYNYIQVFGGNLSLAIQKLGKIAESHELVGIKASSILLRIYSCLEKNAKFLELYPIVLKVMSSIDKNTIEKDDLSSEFSILYTKTDALCVIASHFIIEHNYTEARAILDSTMADLSERGFKLIALDPKENFAQINNTVQEEVELLFIISQIYNFIGNIFELGFEKIANEQIPDTALKAAWFAWLKSYNPRILDFILEKAQEFDIAGGLLDTFIRAYKQGFVNIEQRSIIEAIAKNYYIEINSFID